MDPEDILEGRVEARPGDLFDLIHRVNPTGEELPEQEAARRYAQKRRLQSLLIRRFGDRHLTVATTGDEGIVSLDHRSGARDACHAVIDELEPDARAWVRRQLDLAAFDDEDEVAPEPPGRTEAGGGEAVAELLRRGREAVEEFDYEGGEELLERALAGAPPGTAPAAAAAQALLELQVDTLGVDTAALELEPRLDPRIREVPTVRALLALAAARLGDAERAVSLLGDGPSPGGPSSRGPSLRGPSLRPTPTVAGLSRPRTAEVYAALTAGAIRDRDRDAAQRFLTRLTEIDATHPLIPSLDDEIAGLRADDFHAVEAELERRFRDRGAAAVEAEARALADRWPEGEVARRILRQAAAERRREEIAEHLERARIAGAEQRFADAERHFQAAIDAGAEQPDLPALAAEAREQARRQRRRAEIAGVVGRFAELQVSPPVPQGALGPAADEGRRRQALLAYLALSTGARARVRDQLDEPVLGWLVELEAPRSGARAQSAVTAGLALERAAAALAAGDPRAAVDELEAQRTTLRQVGRARSLWQEAHQGLAEERRRRGREALEAARSALGRGQTAEARRLLDAVPRADLADRDRSRAEELGAEVGAAEARERLERQYDERLAAGDLAVALTRARVLAQRTAATAPGAAWSRRLAELQGRLRSAWRLEVVTEEAAADAAPPPSHWREKSVVWLDGEGRELVLATAWERWLVLSIVDVERSRVTARVSLQTPRPLEQPLVTRRHGDRLWISGHAGDVVELDRNSWDVLGFYPLGELVTGNRSIGGVLTLPEVPWAWIHVKGEWGGDVTWVADRAEHRVVRRLTDSLVSFLPILAGGGPRVLRSGPRLAARLFTAAGEPASSEPLVRGWVSDVDRGPDGRGLLLLAHPAPTEAESADDDSEDRGLELVRFTEPPPGGALERSRALELPEAHPLGFPAVVTAPELGLSFVLIYNRDRSSELLVFDRRTEAQAGERLEPLHRSRWPGHATLVHDWRARRVAAVSFAGDEVEVRRLDGRPPTMAGLGEGRSEPGWPKTVVYANTCGQPTGAVDAAVGELADELRGLDDRALRTHLARTEIRKTATVDDKVIAALALLRLEHRERVYGLSKAVEDLARRLASRHPRHGGVQLLLADSAAREKRWSDVGRCLGHASDAGLDAGRARHFHHLLGLSHLHAGRLRKAHEAFRRGLADGGGDLGDRPCELEPLRQVTRSMAEPPRADEWGPDQPRIQRLVGALCTADAALAAGDSETARTALDRRDIRWEVELQTTARRAAAYLETAAATAEERFRERAALSFFLHVRQLGDYMRHDLFLPDRHWDEERQAEIEARSRARLEHD